MTKKRRRPRVRRVVVVVPSLFTLANLFFGFWSIVLTTQGDYYRASWWIAIAGVLDMLDGLSARMSHTGSAFGAELDSLVDVVSFGVAPAFLVFTLILSNQGPFAWIFSFAFITCVALRLARFNAQQGEDDHRTFTGLPSPAAGLTLAAYYPFTRTDFYQTQLVDLRWPQIMIFLMIGLSLVMVSGIRYAKLPRVGVRTLRGLLGLAIHLIILSFAIWSRDIFFFPFGLAYVSYGVLRWAATALGDRGDDDADLTDDGPELILHEAEHAGLERRSDP